MTQPATGPADPAVIATWAHVLVDDVELVGTVAGVNAFVRGLPVAQLTGDVEEAWPAAVISGATMLAKRYWRRRDTPAGVQQITDDGQVVSIARSDPDVSMLLQLGAYEKPNRVG